MMATRSFYEVLGVARSASPKEIKRAYYALAHRLHPDTREHDTPQADALFAELSEAYAVLGDPHLRRRYDALGSWARHLGPTGNAYQNLTRDPARVRAALELALQELEGRIAAMKLRRGPRLPDHAGTLPFAFNALTGWLRTQRDRASVRAQEAEGTLATWQACDACQGEGGLAGCLWETCATCSGSGKVRWHRAFVRLVRRCSACRGRGRKPQQPCPLCGGAGDRLAARESP